MSQVVVGIIERINPSGESEFLLVSSKKDFGEFTGNYYPPGGHIEDGEEKEEALKREVKEELGVEIIPIEEIAQTSGDIEGQVTYWWKCDFAGDDLDINKDEIVDARFFTKGEMEGLNLWPATKKFFDAHIFNRVDS